MKTEFHYQNLVSGEVVRSQVELQINGLALMAIVEVDELSAEDEKARAMDDLPKLIGKQQKAATTDDNWQMWRYYNNATVAREVLANTADAETLAAFEEMLVENKLSDPDYYGAMTTQAFAEWLIGLNREFKLLGLRLEAERVR
ncbi:MAG: hypothetical protein WBP57_00040, partial [Ignavibacteria bacterium]